MRSLNAIQRSACSCGGMDSHLFSISARVGLDTACAEALRTCCTGATTAALVEAAAERTGREEMRLAARVMGLRSILDGRRIVDARREANWVATDDRGRAEDVDCDGRVVNGAEWRVLRAEMGGCSVKSVDMGIRRQ